MSMKLTPTAVWRTRTSPLPGRETSTSSHRRTSAPPVAWMRTARLTTRSTRLPEAQSYSAVGDEGSTDRQQTVGGAAGLDPLVEHVLETDEGVPTLVDRHVQSDVDDHGARQHERVEIVLELVVDE